MMKYILAILFFIFCISSPNAQPTFSLVYFRNSMASETPNITIGTKLVAKTSYGLDCTPIDHNTFVREDSNIIIGWYAIMGYDGYDSTYGAQKGDTIEFFLVNGIDTIKVQPTFVPGYKGEERGDTSIVFVFQDIMDAKFLYTEITKFDCCELNGDMDHDGDIEIIDLVYLVRYMFRGGPAPLCYTEGDINNSGVIDIVDLKTIVMYMFQGKEIPGCQ